MARSTVRRGVSLLVAVAVVLAVTGVFAGLAIQRASHASSLDSERTQVTAIAGQYAIDFTSADYRNLQAGFNKVAENATPDFKKKYLATVAVFAPIYTKYKIVLTTKVTLAGISSLTANSAVAVVALSGVATSTKSASGVDHSYRIQISLSKVGNRWLTSNVEPL